MVTSGTASRNTRACTGIVIIQQQIEYGGQSPPGQSSAAHPTASNDDVSLVSITIIFIIICYTAKRENGK
ncbi:MAG: hypothetical protein DSZ32_01345 [Gammaproteobacteria bacterium]|nr:MAG: hypothetical protein DSZ32_01345 [Gammaproteobacteria bacterium]